MGTWRLNRKERRRLGVTFFSILAKVWELRKEEAFDKDDIPGMAAAVLDKIIGDNPMLFQGPGWDGERLDRIIEFIERILELLAKWLPIFFAL